MDLNKNRIDERVTLMTKCHLDIDGRRSEGLAENISTDGALIKVGETDSMYISVGDKGTVTILLSPPVKYACTVIRKVHGELGVQFHS
jgi:hypothetical protein